MGHGSLDLEVMTHDPSGPSIYVTQVTQVTHDPCRPYGPRAYINKR